MSDGRRQGNRGARAARGDFSRRDFLNGVLVGAGGLAASGLLGACSEPGNPAAATGGGGGGELGNPLPVGLDKGDVTTLCHAVRDGKGPAAPAAGGALLDCVVIGGGISGLTAAWKLRKLGHDAILVLEKESPAGGLSRSDGAAPLLYSQATAYTVFPYNDGLVELYTDLGIVTGKDKDGAPTIAAGYVLSAPVNNAYIDGAWHADVWETGLDALPYDDKLKQDLAAFREDMKKWYDYVGKDGKIGFDTPSDASTEDADVRALDDMTLAEYVAQKGWDPRVSEFWDPYARSAFGTTHDALSTWAAINFLGSEFHPTLSRPGGNAHLARALADKVGGFRIKTGAFVSQAVIAGAEVHVTYVEGGVAKTIRAKTVIYAAPRFFARYVLPDLAEEGRDEAGSFHYTPYVVANVHVSRTPAGLGYDNWVYGDYFFTDLIVADWAGQADPSKAPLDRPNVLTVYCPLVGSGRRSELLEQPMAYYEEKILADLEKVLPGVGATVTQFDLYRWGHAMLAADKGFVFGKPRVGSQTPTGPISYACNDVDGLPAFENAVAAGLRAATEVSAKL
jgi:protoporphyrinogen oxidase